MYDDAIRGAVIDRVRDFINQLSNHPEQAILVAAGVALLVLWITRNR